MYSREGNFGTLKIDGLSWIVVYSWPGALHEGNGTVQPFIDKKASEEQRNALLTILSGQGGNAWFEVLASIVTTIHEPQFVQITWQFDNTLRKAGQTVTASLER